MRDKELYAQILGLSRPCSIAEVELDTPGEEVRVMVDHDGDESLCCPECGEASPGYDTRR